MTRRVAVTGMGCVSGLGQGVAETWRRTLAGEGAVAPFALPRGEAYRVTGPAAAVRDLDITALERRFGARALGHLDPLGLFAVVAAAEALDDARLTGDAVLDRRTAIVLGCGSGGNETFEGAYRRLYGQGQTKLHPQTIPMAMISAPASRLAMLFGVHGQTMTVASACASSAHALGEAMHMIRAGRADVAIAGGAEACLTLGSWAAWASLGALAPDTCRPFSADRKGLVLGEGAAVLVLEDWERAVARDAPIHAELIGYGASSDAVHITTPDRSGIEAAIRAAHADAGLGLDVPTLISSHGTGTRLNDATEARRAALRAWRGAGPQRGDRDQVRARSPDRRGGRAGVPDRDRGVEAGRAPPVLNHLGVDPDCALPLALAPAPIAFDHLVSNSFAFGGLNAVLIGRRA